jgi:crotonobetainyl-CoA:carnitine CoA-transferase CaiB-like acyl-CoA transferase
MSIGPALEAGALRGVRAVSLVDGLGAYAPRLLQGLGADVVGVEPPGGAPRRRRPSRYVAGSGDGEGPSLYFLHYAAGTQGVTLDPTQPEGRALLERLVRSAQIVIDNGDLARLGFDLDGLAGDDGGRVVVSVTPFGLDGPRSHWLGPDLICQAMSGMIAAFGYRGDRPARFGPEQASEMAGLAAALGALIALYGQRHGHGGAVVDVPVQRVCALVTLQMANASLYHQFGFERHRREREPGLPGGLYQAADGYFALAAWRDIRQTIAVLEQHGAGDGLGLLHQELGDAVSQDTRANAAVERFVASMPRAELAEVVQRAGMLGLPVHDASDLLADPFLEARATFVEVEAPGVPTPLLDVGTPVRLSGSPYVPGRRPPMLGEHNDVVYGGLGLDEAALGALRAGRVI